MINEDKARAEITAYRDHCKKLHCMFSIFFFSQFQNSTKVPTCHFSSHCEILPTCNHSNVRSSTVKMAKQSSVILRTEQHSVEVMICTSLTVATLTNTNQHSYSNFGNTHQPPAGYQFDTPQTQSLFAGSYKFTPTEIEVFY